MEVNRICSNLNLRTSSFGRGQVGILAHHMPLASGIEISEMSYIIDKQRHYMASLDMSRKNLPSVVDLYMLMMMKQK